jgi:hypothetical protein
LKVIDPYYERLQYPFDRWLVYEWMMNPVDELNEFTLLNYTWNTKPIFLGIFDLDQPRAVNQRQYRDLSKLQDEYKEILNFAWGNLLDRKEDALKRFGMENCAPPCKNF